MNSKQLEILCTLDNVLSEVESNIELTEHLAELVQDLHVFAQIHLAVNGCGSFETATNSFINSRYWKELFEETEIK